MQIASFANNYGKRELFCFHVARSPPQNVPYLLIR